MENPTYQRIFSAFNACLEDPRKSSTAQDFLALSATPETMLKTLSTIRSIGSEKLFLMHKTSYLRGLMTSLKSDAWNQSHTTDLVNVTDWLISLRDKSHHSTNYLQLLRTLTETVQQKVPVPQEKKQEWAKRLVNKSSYIPQYSVNLPVECYGRTYTKAHTQFFSADDRN